MLQIRNTQLRYGLVAIFFHWLIACLIIFMLGLGLYMTGLPKGEVRSSYYALHKALGILILFLVTCRIIWWFQELKPELNKLNAFQKFAAKVSHLLLYVFMVLMPLSGWLLSSSAGIAVSFFGWFNMPNIFYQDVTARSLFHFTHVWSSYFFIGLIGLHVIAALHHHFIYKDDILRRMLP